MQTVETSDRAGCHLTFSKNEALRGVGRGQIYCDGDLDDEEHSMVMSECRRAPPRICLNRAVEVKARWCERGQRQENWADVSLVDDEAQKSFGVRQRGSIRMLCDGTEG